MRDAIDVDPARCDVGRDEHGNLVGFEIIECPLTRVLALVAVNRLGANPAGMQMTHDAIRAVLVERGTPGVEYEVIDKLAHRTCQNVTMTFRGARVPETNLLAEGAGDLYPRFGRTMEWDTAAPQAVLEAAGGRLLAMDGSELRYGKPGWANPAFLCTGFGH